MMVRKMTPLGELMRGLLVCDRVCLSVVSPSRFLSGDKSRFPGWWSPGEGIYDNWFLLEHLSWGRQGSSEKASACIVLFQVPIAPSNQHAKVAGFGVIRTEPLLSCFRVTYSATLQLPSSEHIEYGLVCSVSSTKQFLI